MKIQLSDLNLILAWVWIVLGFASGLALGLKFRQEDWLGGYASLKRRLYRLAHVSLFGLGALNLLFHLTARIIPKMAGFTEVAASLFVVGAMAMPVCCVVVAHRPKAHVLFAVPVLSLLAAGTLTLWMVIRHYWRFL